MRMELTKLTRQQNLHGTIKSIGRKGWNLFLAG
jgi:hypothetical protein